jgi:hypothetical protein
MLTTGLDALSRAVPRAPRAQRHDARAVEGAAVGGRRLYNLWATEPHPGAADPLLRRPGWAGGSLLRFAGSGVGFAGLGGA